MQAHLATIYASSRFSAVIDAVGIQDIFNHCPGFLAEGKPFVSIGPKAKSYTYGGLITTIGLMAKNALLPRFMGGVPREYVQVTGIANLEAMELLARMMEEGTLRVRVGTVVAMGDVPEVSFPYIMVGIDCKIDTPAGLREDVEWACSREDRGKDPERRFLNSDCLYHLTAHRIFSLIISSLAT